ncbi:hypothetical protein [Methylocystis heyeri]|uniref:DUF1570 domain-containing protein n=1 Tax=Methylocystis heyeri TaxID=391905 RepID=A0A6B8KD58_9HYPH|nr:hypothetical protein [Methylocystis heyeri]QGM45617.1 hypothetical protein H2LOC_007840 [Methylocystis heyeri]
MRGFRPLALAFLASFAAAGCSPVSAALHDPQTLPALPQDPRIHYQPGAAPYATAVAALLPQAAATIEAVQGRPFGKPFTVTVFADDDAYAAANGLGTPKARGVTFFDRVTLSPALWREDSAYLEADLTHELSHEHLHSNLSAADYFAIPVWFVEGLAVMASGGGGAQRVSTREAERAIAQGRFIDTPDEANVFANFSLAPPRGSEKDENVARMHLAYRQASLFVVFLREEKPEAFKALMNRLFEGERFRQAFDASYAESLAAARARFIAKTIAGTGAPGSSPKGGLPAPATPI